MITFIRLAGRRVCMPSLGAASACLTNTTIKQNLCNADTQFKTMAAAVEKFKVDAVSTFADSTVEPEACGCAITFPENDNYPYITSHPVKTIEDIRRLKVPDPHKDGRMPVFVKTVKLLAEHFTMIIGAGGLGPFTLAGELAGVETIALKLRTDPNFVKKLLEYAVQVIIPYQRALVDAGADIILLGEPLASILSPKFFEEFSKEYIAQVVDSINKPVCLHICGDATRLVEKMCDTGVQSISLDSPVDLLDIMTRVPRDVIISGNLSPVEVLLNLDADGVRKATKELLDKMKGVKNYVISCGCDLVPGTPIENIAAMLETVRNYRG